ncbi:MAG: DUF1836 domain-containing protein [Bacillota bacterium]|nr:DUF1836 domain-containing protein [Bacillota bacterium]
MENVDNILELLGLENKLTLEEIPKIDLYMDQVIQLFENKFSETKRNEDEKVLTKTMINNYAKGKLLFPIKNKKYSKEHLILMSLIYQLKGALSINDIKTTLGKINEKIMKEDFQLDSFYESYLNLTTRNVQDFKVDVGKRAEQVIDQETGVEDLEKILLIASLANMSNLYRRVAEKLVDEMVEAKPGKGHK